MGFLAKVGEFFAGGLADKAMEFVNTRWPPNMSESDRKHMEMVIREMEHRHEKELIVLGQEAEAEFNQRIKDLEGTASDLKAIPVFGTIILFLRGCQRPVWGFATIAADFHWFINSPTFTDRQETALIIINLLVLGFLFGERTIKNLSPLIMQVWGKGGNTSDK